MKKIFATMALIVAIATSAAAMTTSQLRSHARVMTDRMSAELHLTRHQAERVYHINLEYLNTMDKPNANVPHLVNLRNHEMRRVLTAHQYNRYISSSCAHWNPVRHGWRNTPAHHPHHPHGYKVARPRHHRR